MDISCENQRQKEARDKWRQTETQLNSSVELVREGSKKQELEKEYPSEFLVGDLVWVHIRGSPLWPAVLAYHPIEGQYTKIICNHRHVKMRAHRIYHVQFLCDNGQTYWIRTMNMIPFQGYDSLVNYLSGLKEKLREMKLPRRQHAEQLLKTLSYMKKVTTGTRHERWIQAIKEASASLELDRYERIQKYTSILPDLSLDNDKEGDKLNHQRNTARRKVYRNDHVEDTTDGKYMGSEINLVDFTKSQQRAVGEEYSDTDSRKGHSGISDDSLDGFGSQHFEYTSKRARLSAKKSRSRLGRRQSRLSAEGSQIDGRSISQTFLKRKLSDCSENDNSSENSGPVSKRRRQDQDLDDSQDNQGMYRVTKNEKVCYRCENVSSKGGLDMVRCRGPCVGVFHLECLGLVTMPPSDFRCDECQNGRHACFICKSVEGETVRCLAPLCGKFYHIDCADTWPQTLKQRASRLICPRHVCHMCAAVADDMTDSVARTAPFTRCLRCPSTYHVGEQCIAAGCEELTQSHHICTKHLQPHKGVAYHINVNWCFCCSKGGSLLLCDQCPAAFHADCMKISAPEGGYVCEDCEMGRFPMYGDVVWIKIGIYRWWPGEVLHPRNIPDNIENMPHPQGSFCVHFFGSNEYNWVTRGRTFLYQDGDKGSGGGCSKTLEKRFLNALNEAAEAYRMQQNKMAKREARHSGKNKGNQKPPPYVRIDINKPVGNVRLGKVDFGSVNKCDCDPNSESPCSSDEKCINRMLNFECIKEVCPGKDRCCNQRFQKRQYPALYSFKTEGRGWGLKTAQDIKKGEFVIEYVGELIDDEEFKRRIELMHKVKEENYYFLTLDKDRMIDAGPKGNLARFMNHSCRPNCETQKWTVGGETRVGLFALADLPAGSELTFNYNLQCVGTEKKECHCGAPNCSGYIGVKVQKPELRSSKSGRLNGRKKKKKKRKEVKETEEDCFRCGTPGDLLLCDVTNCPKGYHLKCLGLTNPPKGKWLCPWHHCDECGNRAAVRCSLCPNSFCRNHMEGNMMKGDVGDLCTEHSQEEIEYWKGMKETNGGTKDGLQPEGSSSPRCCEELEENGSPEPDSGSAKAPSEEEEAGSRGSSVSDNKQPYRKKKWGRGKQRRRRPGRHNNNQGSNERQKGCATAFNHSSITDQKVENNEVQNGLTDNAKKS